MIDKASRRLRWRLLFVQTDLCRARSPGELHIGGEGLARGYLKKPQLSAERFTPNPFSNGNHSARLYKTGDLVRFLDNGNLEFLGRTDHQVKIRGFRIELGEIEANLSKHPAVREAAVLVRERGVESSPDVKADKVLVAYVSSVQQAEPTINELRFFLQERLPDFMVPSAFVILENLPRTANGKLDRSALPETGGLRPELEESYVAPETSLEILFSTIWRDLLGIDKVGIYDNFFALGGHSLLCMQVVDQIEKSTGLKINPGEMMFQTMGQLASVCQERIQSLQQDDRLNSKVTLLSFMKSRLFSKR